MIQLLLVMTQIVLLLENLFFINNLIWKYGSPVAYFGKKVTCSSACYFLSEMKFIIDTFQQAGLNDDKIVKNPLDLNHNFVSIDGEMLPDPNQCQQIVGNLLYLTVTWPDITFVVHVVSQLVAEFLLIYGFTNLSISSWTMTTELLLPPILSLS